MSAKASIIFSAKGFAGANKPIEINLDVEVVGVPSGALSVEAAKELLARIAIMLVDPTTHEQLARDLTTRPVPLPPARGRQRAALERVK
jgi:hypothetical protein